MPLYSQKSNLLTQIYLLRDCHIFILLSDLNIKLKIIAKKQLFHKSFLLNISCVINRFLKDNKREIDVHVIGDKRIQNRVRSCWLFRWLLT